MSSNSWLGYGLGYMTKYPIFKNCHRNGALINPNSKDFDTYCVPSYFCKNKNEINIEIDNKDTLSLKNWTVDFDLICIS